MADSRYQTPFDPAIHTEPVPPAQYAPPPAGPLLSVSHLYKYYGDLLAVDDVSFDLYPGEIVGLVGPNGAGKTTILRCIAGIIRFVSGEIICNGISVNAAPADAKRWVSLVSEVPNLYDLLTVLEHLRFFHMAFDEQDQFMPRAEHLIERLNLTEQRDSLVSELSKGMRQKLAVACAFVHSSSIFLFDEPFIGIDPAGQKAVREIILEHAALGATVLLSSHALETIEHLSHRILVLHEGRLIARGDVDQLRRRARLGDDTPFEDVFLTLTQGTGEY